MVGRRYCGRVKLSFSLMDRDCTNTSIVLEFGILEFIYLPLFVPIFFVLLHSCVVSSLQFEKISFLRGDFSSDRSKGASRLDGDQTISTL